jgi:hypothetical protein
MKRKSKVTDERKAPFLRLRGKWLEKAGFPRGTNTEVIVSQNLIIIKPI